MKYCKKCGMLLENTHKVCIRCGADVSDPNNVSLYPPEVELGLDEEKKTNKKKGSVIAGIIACFVILLLLIGLIIWKMPSMSVEPEEPVEEETVEPEPTEAPDEIVEEPAESREVNDKVGMYYNCNNYLDDNGSPVFTAVFPEELTVSRFTPDDNRYCNEIPRFFTFVAGNEDDTVHFSYMSPQKLWYKDSMKGHTRKNERDPQYYMSYLKYDGGEGYLDLLLKESYPDAKKIELTGVSDAPAEIVKKVDDMTETRKQELYANIGDIGHMGDDALYVFMDSEYSAKIYEYEIKQKDGEDLFCKFYVPIMAEEMSYASEYYDDMGTIVEWYVLSVVGMECGNIELYEQYTDAFNVFCQNAAPTREFLYSCEARSKIVNDFIAKDQEPPILEQSGITTLMADYTPDSKLSDFGEGLLDLLTSGEGKKFTAEGITVYLPYEMSVAFYNKETNKIFMSTDSKEYPGDDYLELVKSTAEDAAESEGGAEGLGVDEGAMAPAAGSAEESIDGAGVELPAAGIN